MKPGIEEKGELRPTGPWARAPEGRDDLDGAGSATLANSERGRRSRSGTQRYASIRVTRRLSAPAERVFDAWLEPEVAGRWLFATASQPMTDVDIDPRVGGSFRFADGRNGARTEHTGEYIEIVPHRRLVFTLAMPDRPHVVTRVTAEISPLKTGCELALTHENVPPDRADRTEARWTGVLYGLDETLKSLRGRRSSS
jgi:uncharacterized protein YndB with AHSA1/START domain